MFRNFFDGPHLLVIAVLVILLFGWKRLPDAARSVGRSMRILKSEVNEMKQEGKSTPSAASSDTVRGETVPQPPQDAPRPTADPTQQPAPAAPQQPVQEPVQQAPVQQPHNQPPA